MFFIEEKTFTIFIYLFSSMVKSFFSFILYFKLLLMMVIYLLLFTNHFEGNIYIIILFDE